MERTLTAIRQNGGKIVLRVEQFPPTCPVCHRSINATPRLAYLSDDCRLLEGVFLCPAPECRHLFIAFLSQPTPHITDSVYRLYDMAPRVFLDRVFSVHIVKTSPRFARVFHQAAQAEGQGLDEIAGPGYRKALEFLIKDYAISIGHTHADVIRSKLLGKVIDDHVADVNVKSTAKRAAWIGNDETHYDRVWEDRDIEDLKVLIELTVRWIESEKMTREYEEKMAARKPTK